MFNLLGPKSARLSNRKSKIMSDFEKPLNNLKKLHDEHTAHHEKISSKIEKLNDEKLAVEKSKQDTARLVDKFEKFLS